MGVRGSAQPRLNNVDPHCLLRSTVVGKTSSPVYSGWGMEGQRGCGACWEMGKRLPIMNSSSRADSTKAAPKPHRLLII